MWTRLRTDPLTTYIDSHGFNRAKFSSSTKEWHYSWSRFMVTPVYTRAKDTLPSDPTPLPQPDCELSREFCGYMRDAFWSKRNEASAMTTKRGSDLDNPSHYCDDRPQCFWEMGQELIFIHWSQSQSAGASVVAINRELDLEPTPVTYFTTAITFRGDDLWQEPRGRKTFPPPLTTSVLYGNFTFTSPTVYIGHHPISVAQGLGPKQPRTEIVKAGIFPIALTNIYTDHLSIDNPNEWASKVAHGVLEQPFSQPQRSIVGIDLIDFEEPVPPVAYYSHNSYCWSAGTVCKTITEGQFRPKLYLHDHVWNSVLSNGGYSSECWFPQVWDPDIDLKAIPGSDPPPVAFPRRQATKRKLHTSAGTTTISECSQNCITYSSPTPHGTPMRHQASLTQSLVPQQTV
jgi:hypothetical protein